MAPNIGEHQHEILKHIAALIEEQKHEINIFYSELKLRLPSYLKTITIQQLRDVGATIDPDITIPRGVGKNIQKQAFINEKLDEIRDNFRAQVIKYYDNLKRQLPKDLLSKEMGDLTDEEWILLGVSTTKSGRGDK